MDMFYVFLPCFEECSCVPPCEGRQQRGRHPRAGLKRIVGKQGRGAHYKKRMSKHLHHSRDRRREGEGETEAR